MELKMVDHTPVLPGVNEPTVLISFLVLPPLQIDKCASRIIALYPIRPARHYPFDYSFIIAFAKIILNILKDTVSVLGAGLLLLLLNGILALFAIVWLFAL